MGDDSTRFLEQLVRDAIARGRDAVPPARSGRGGVAITLATALFQGMEVQLHWVLSSLLAEDEKQEALHRLSLLADYVHEVVAPVFASLDNRDIPAGVLYLVDELVRQLLGRTADAIIHPSSEANFSVLSLADEFADTLGELFVEFDPGHKPLVLLVPDLRVQTVLLAPLLVHEVGHVAVTAPLLDLLEVQLADDITNLLDHCVDLLPAEERTEETRAEWKYHMNVWAEELVCDAFACAVAGPSVLFALAVFLPAPGDGELSTHPFPPDRIRLTIAHLRELGWTEVLGAAPATLTWLDGVAELMKEREPQSPKEEFLRGAVDLFAPRLLDLARMAAPVELSPEDFRLVEPELTRCLQGGIPPTQLASGAGAPTWPLVLAAWLYQMGERGYGDRPESFVAAASDSEFGRFVLKAIELARIVDYWRSDDPAQMGGPQGGDLGGQS